MSKKIPNPIWTESSGMVSVIGSYKQNVGGQIHAVIKNLHGSKEAPYRTLCGTYTSLYSVSGDGSFTQNGHKLYIHSLPFRNVTCKRCLHIINNAKQSTRPIYRPKVTDHLGRPTELMGTHCGRFQTVHAMVSTSDTIRAICGAVFPDDTYPYKPWPNNTKGRHKMVSSITCKQCLKVLESSGIVPDKPAKKKFFLVEYAAEEVVKYTCLEDLKADIKNCSNVVAKIMVIDAYETLYIKNVPTLVDKDGNEILESTYC